MECTRLGLNPNVNYGLQVIITGQCIFITRSLFTTLAGDVANRGCCACVGAGITWETSLPSAKSCYEHKDQSLSRVQLLATPWTAAHQASLSITDSQSLLILTSIESVMPSNGSKIIKSIKVYFGKSKRVPEKHLFLLSWLWQSLWPCGSQ